MTDIHTLERLLRRLRLTRIATEWHSQEKRALAEGWTPSRYLLSLCSEEATHRESERLRRYIKDARLPVGKTLAEYDFSQVPELNAAQASVQHMGQYLRGRNNGGGSGRQADPSRVYL